MEDGVRYAQRKNGRGKNNKPVPVLPLTHPCNSRPAERVGPRLKVAAVDMAAGGREWRAHLEQTKQVFSGVRVTLNKTTPPLVLPMLPS